MTITERNVQEIGKSLLITLPKKWADSLNISKGSKLKIISGEHGSLSIAPDFVRNTTVTEATIPFDDHYQRRFFREYFRGCQTITFHGEVSANKRRELQVFLKRFMNVQVIEDGKSKIVLKCFQINELTIEECLKRMHFLSLNLMDEVSGKNREEMKQDLRDNITRFYYLLVLQVRRFLSEGRHLTEQSIPLIRAMDLRMVAEKIQRIVILLSSMKPSNLQAVKEYYSHCFSVFINDDFEQSVFLQSEGRELARKKKEHSELYTYAKEISLLIR